MQCLILFIEGPNVNEQMVKALAYEQPQIIAIGEGLMIHPKYIEVQEWPCWVNGTYIQFAEN